MDWGVECLVFFLGLRRGVGMGGAAKSLFWIAPGGALFSFVRGGRMGRGYLGILRDSYHFISICIGGIGRLKLICPRRDLSHSAALLTGLV